MASETHRFLILLAAVGLLFFCSTLVLDFVSPTYGSPDETANAFFSETFAASGRLFSFEPLNTFLGDVLRPRSIISIDGRLLPVSFIGLPILFGFLIKIFGFWSLPIWTPLFAVAAVLAWYAIIGKLFGRRLGFWSALLLFITPAWWYWTARPLMHNVLFVALLIFTTFFLVARPIKFLKEKIGWLDFVLAGVCVSLSVWVRTFEAAWIAPIVFLGLLVFWKKFFWQGAAFFVASAVLTMTPLLFLNSSLYGEPWGTGYSVNEVEAVVGAEAGDLTATELPAVIETENPLSLLPFGLHPRLALQHILDYALLMFWWLAIPAAAGFICLVCRWDKEWKAWWFYLIVLAVLAAWLGLVYGSWTIYDNPDKSVTIGNSYTRYWLPIFVMITPLVAAALLKIASLAKGLQPLVLAVGFIIVLVLSGNIVFFSSDDALWPMRARLVEAAVIHERVFELTELDSVIIVDRADKLFFPARRVRYPLRDETTYALMPKIVSEAPLYYYGIILPQTDLDYLNDEKLKGLGLGIKFVENFSKESLYKIFLLE